MEIFVKVWNYVQKKTFLFQQSSNLLGTKVIAELKSFKKAVIFQRQKKRRTWCEEVQLGKD